MLGEVYDAKKWDAAIEQAREAVRKAEEDARKAEKATTQEAQRLHDIFVEAYNVSGVAREPQAHELAEINRLSDMQETAEKAAAQAKKSLSDIESAGQKAWKEYSLAKKAQKDAENSEKEAQLQPMTQKRISSGGSYSIDGDRDLKASAIDLKEPINWDEKFNAFIKEASEKIVSIFTDPDFTKAVFSKADKTKMIARLLVDGFVVNGFLEKMDGVDIARFESEKVSSMLSKEQKEKMLEMFFIDNEQPLDLLEDDYKAGFIDSLAKNLVEFPAKMLRQGILLQAQKQQEQKARDEAAKAARAAEDVRYAAERAAAIEAERIAAQKAKQPLPPNTSSTSAARTRSTETSAGAATSPGSSATGKRNLSRLSSAGGAFMPARPAPTLSLAQMTEKARLSKVLEQSTPPLRPASAPKARPALVAPPRPTRGPNAARTAPVAPSVSPVGNRSMTATSPSPNTPPPPRPSNRNEAAGSAVVGGQEASSRPVSSGGSAGTRPLRPAPVAPLQPKPRTTAVEASPRTSRPQSVAVQSPAQPVKPAGAPPVPRVPRVRQVGQSPTAPVAPQRARPASSQFSAKPTPATRPAPVLPLNGVQNLVAAAPAALPFSYERGKTGNQPTDTAGQITQLENTLRSPNLQNAHREKLLEKLKDLRDKLVMESMKEANSVARGMQIAEDLMVNEVISQIQEKLKTECEESNADDSQELNQDGTSSETWRIIFARSCAHAFKVYDAVYPDPNRSPQARAIQQDAFIACVLAKIAGDDGLHKLLKNADLQRNNAKKETSGVKSLFSKKTPKISSPEEKFFSQVSALFAVLRQEKFQTKTADGVSVLAKQYLEQSANKPRRMRPGSSSAV